jgi:hypothetical protein
MSPTKQGDVMSAESEAKRIREQADLLEGSRSGMKRISKNIFINEDEILAVFRSSRTCGSQADTFTQVVFRNGASVSILPEQGDALITFLESNNQYERAENEPGNSVSAVSTVKETMVATASVET